MSAFNYGPLAATAVALIKSFGKTVTMYEVTNTAPDSTKPWRQTTQSQSSITPQGVVTSFTTEEEKDERIRADDLKLLVAGQDPAIGAFNPMNETFVTVDGVKYAGTGIEQIKPGPTVLLYIVRLRKM